MRKLMQERSDIIYETKHIKIQNKIVVSSNLIREQNVECGVVKGQVFE